MMNKKGEEGGSPIGLIVTIVVIGVAALILILLFTGTFGKISDLFQKAPGDLEIFGQACAGYIDVGTFSSYCRQFNPGTIYGIGGVYNCQFEDIRKSVEAEKGAVACGTLFTAGYATAADSAKTECTKLEGNNQLKPNTYINGKKCDVEVAKGGWGIVINPATPTSIS